MDLVRELLLAIEDAKHAPRLSDLVSEIEQNKYEAAAYHVRMLVEETGFVRGIDASSMDGDDWIELKLTWTGHDFLNDIRDPNIWRKTKEGAGKIGSFSFDIVAGIAKGYVKAEAQRLLGIDLADL